MRKIIEITPASLAAAGFDGMRSPDGECGCLRDDLAPCGSMPHDCEPGYRGAYKDDPSDWAIYPTKAAADDSLGATGATP